ncbi:hypothetical protein [Stackebrandtia soli]|uniref:hypothetical protein n=1 Tax=Stackebrandtia soli TaxID=1892856 RepID=UPI0039EA84D4
MQQSEAVAAAARHPRDPEPVPSTKAAAAFALGLVALVTAPVIGGVIPAVIALRLCDEADADIAESNGFLLGAARSRRARFFARLAFGVAGFVVVAGVLWWLYRLAIAPPTLPTVDPNVD